MNDYKKISTLTLNKEFKRAYYQGKSKVTPYFVCYKIKNRSAGIRYGITTSKKVGNAVQRNRARRVLRVAFFAVLSKLSDNCDYVLVARERILTAKSYQVAAALKGCLKDFEKWEKYYFGLYLFIKSIFQSLKNLVAGTTLPVQAMLKLLFKGLAQWEVYFLL